eukprot:362510-Chlamydomonas_euryale.AAC.3
MCAMMSARCAAFPISPLSRACSVRSGPLPCGRVCTQSPVALLPRPLPVCSCQCHGGRRICRNCRPGASQAGKGVQQAGERHGGGRPGASQAGKGVQQAGERHGGGRPGVSQEGKGVQQAGRGMEVAGRGPVKQAKVCSRQRAVRSNSRPGAMRANKDVGMTHDT